MKLFKLLMTLSVGGAAMLTSCENSTQEFPDYEGGSAVYFAYQSPVRTIVLGEDFYDTTLDNQFRFEIYAVKSGVYKNRDDVTIDVEVDNTLTEQLWYDDGGTRAVLPMPTGYYKLARNQIVIENGNINGAVGVQLDAAFFEDPKALSNNYVVPLVMKKVAGADNMLTGTLKEGVGAASRTDSESWEVLPKDYVLYCVKFINPWDAIYLRRGEDKVTVGGTTTTVVRKEATVEKDEVFRVTSAGLKTAKMTVTADAGGGVLIPCELLLTFAGGLDGKGTECTISSATPGMTAGGTGKWVIDGEQKAWGNEDRNALYLEYNVDFGPIQHETTDVLVFRDRGIQSERFTSYYIPFSNVKK